jgi:hypothetical protein
MSYKPSDEPLAIRLHHEIPTMPPCECGRDLCGDLHDELGWYSRLTIDPPNGEVAELTDCGYVVPAGAIHTGFWYGIPTYRMPTAPTRWERIKAWFKGGE